MAQDHAISTAGVPASIVTDPPGVSLENLKPGDTYSTTVAVTNTAGFPVELSSVVSRTGALFTGPNPLVVTFDVVSDHGRDCPSLPEALPAGSHARVLIDVVFPAAAGNEYQRQSAQATLFFTATQITQEQCFGSAAPPSGGDGGTGAAGGGALADTGLESVLPLLLALGLALLGAAVRATAARRRTAKALR